MSDIKTLMIDGRKYQLVVMPPWQGAEFAAEVAGLLTGALASEAGEAKELSDMKSDISSGGMSDDMIKRVTSMVMRILPHIKPKEFTALARQAFRGSDLSVGGDMLSEEGLFDQHFGKHRGDYFPVAIWAIKENCAGFFGGGGTAWSALAGQLIPSKSQKGE